VSGERARKNKSCDSWGGVLGQPYKHCDIAVKLRSLRRAVLRVMVARARDCFIALLLSSGVGCVGRTAA